jgi:hypothetical protein
MPFFFRASLTSKRSAKSLAAEDPDLQVDGLLVVVQDGQPLVESTADRSLADHRELRVDVHGARPGDEEEAGLEVLEVVRRQRIQALAVYGQHPLREEARVEREEAGRVGQRRPRCRRACR